MEPWQSIFIFDIGVMLSEVKPVISPTYKVHIHAQYFNGCGRTPLNYSEKYDAFRLEISAIR